MRKSGKKVVTLSKIAKKIIVLLLFIIIFSRDSHRNIFHLFVCNWRTFLQWVFSWRRSEHTDWNVHSFTIVFSEATHLKTRYWHGVIAYLPFRVYTSTMQSFKFYPKWECCPHFLNKWKWNTTWVQPQCRFSDHRVDSFWSMARSFTKLSHFVVFNSNTLQAPGTWRWPRPGPIVYKPSPVQ